MQDAEGAADSSDEYSAAVRCGSCGWEVAESKVWLHSPEAQRRPCPSCSAQDAWIAELGFTDTFELREFIGLKGKEPGRKKPVLELQDGDQMEHSTGRWMKKWRLIDRDRDLYEETVVDAETGEVRHVCREPLSQHWGHGSAKQRDLWGEGLLRACRAGVPVPPAPHRPVAGVREPSGGRRSGPRRRRRLQHGHCREAVLGSGKHRAPGGNAQAVIRSDGLPVWVSQVAPGHRHDLTVARGTELIRGLNWAASALDLPTLADAGYDGADQAIKTPIRQPASGQVLAADNQTYNALHRATRCRGERGFALLTRRWRALRRVTVSPHRTGEITRASFVLTQIENVELRHPW